MNCAVYYTILIALCISTVKCQSCQANDNEPGTCLSLYDCRYIVHLIRDGKRRVAYFDDHFSVCREHGDGQYICCPNIQPVNIGSSITANNSDNVPEFGKIEDVSNHPNLNLLPENCGRISDTTIANTLNTSLNEFPFIALLRYESVSGITFSCGGTIINERYILTAGHCATGSIKLVSVRVGEHFISKSRDCLTTFEQEFCAPPVEDIEVEEIIRHPSYNRPRFANNIAMIRLRSRINFNNSNMNAVCLPINNETQYAPLNNLLTVGWGLSSRGSNTDFPVKVILHVVDKDTCQQIHRSIEVLESQICAVGVSDIDLCRGDSGGPLFYPAQVHKSVRHVQYGILSAGTILCVTEIPNSYTRISYYMKWILDQLRP